MKLKIKCLTNYPTFQTLDQDECSNSIAQSSPALKPFSHPNRWGNEWGLASRKRGRTQAQLSNFKLGKKLFHFMSYEILKIVKQTFQKVGIWLLSECKDFLITFFHIMTHLYLQVQMKSLEDFKWGWIIQNVYIKRGKNSKKFGDITIEASPPIYIFQHTHSWLSGRFTTESVICQVNKEETYLASKHGLTTVY